MKSASDCFEFVNEMFVSLCMGWNEMAGAMVCLEGILMQGWI